MNAKYWFVGLAVAMVSAAEAAGIDWSYDGEKTYQKALIVWTDAGLSLNPKQAIETTRQEMLNEIAKPSLTKWGTLVTLGDKDRVGALINADTIDNPGPTPTRINHALYYGRDREGWGFSLLANLDANGNVIDFAINEISSGAIISEIRENTSLTIHDSDLTVAICGAGGYATGPSICRCGECRQEGNRATRSTGEAFTLGISNAVKGFGYNVLESDTPNGEFRPSVITNVVPEVSGEYDFEIPIDPDCKAKFYKVEVFVL